jgi:hypothetical protein
MTAAKRRCVHPIAAIIQPSPFDPQLLCKLCKAKIAPPQALRQVNPSKSLIESVSAFLKYLTECGDSGAQMNPRVELSLILSMSEAMHALHQENVE